MSSSEHSAELAALKKQRAARAALSFLRDDMILGVGTGSTVDAFVDLLAETGWNRRLKATVSSSEATAARLRAIGVSVLDLNDIESLSLYVDGADEATRARMLIKGGGAALTREKIVASAAERFICIVDDSKLVASLGQFPLPVEVIPMARALVARRLSCLGGDPQWRRGVVTDNGNCILDVCGLSISDPVALEAAINQIAGVVTVGLFAQRPADLLLVGEHDSVRTV